VEKQTTRDGKTHGKDQSAQQRFHGAGVERPRPNRGDPSFDNIERQ
jgi:hypothetical protein